MLAARNALTRLTPRVAAGGPATRTAVRRGLAADAHHAPKEYTGFEAKVRKVLPQDQHIVMGIVGLYTGIFFICKAAFGGSKGEAPASPAAAAPASSDIPSMETDEFYKWLEGAGNIEKWVASLEKV